MLLLLLLLGTALGQKCAPGWTFFSNRCWKHIIEANNPQNHDQMRIKCADEASWLAPGDSLETMNFLSTLSLHYGNWNLKNDSLISTPLDPSLGSNGAVVHVGAYRYGGQWMWYFHSSKYVKWCTAPPPTGPTLLCAHMTVKPPCITSVSCDAKTTRYICQRDAQKLVCSHGAALNADSFCVCESDFFDIKDSHIPEGKLYKRGEFCLPRTPCQNITSKASLSIIFVVDSSQSIGENNWNNMVRFIKGGANLLDNTIKVGFVQFSTNVTYSKWLPNKWSKDDYLDNVPSNFDAGNTNTPVALDEAGAKFAEDKSRHKVAVLITDGMPFVDGGVLPKEEAMPKTKDAAERLYNAGVDLVALGYGMELQKYGGYLMKILKRPRQDYFEFDKEASDLKDIHMTVLLNKVCERF